MSNAPAKTTFLGRVRQTLFPKTPAPAPAPPVAHPLILPNPVVAPPISAPCSGVTVNTGSITINGVANPGSTTATSFSVSAKSVATPGNEGVISVPLNSNVSFSVSFSCAIVVYVKVTDPNGNLVINPSVPSQTAFNGPISVTGTFMASISGNYLIDIIATGSDGSLIDLQYTVSTLTPSGVSPAPSILTSPLPPPSTSGQPQLDQDPTSPNLWLWILIIIIILILLWLLWRQRQQS